MLGLDLLGIARYPKIADRYFPPGVALGAFANTFGDALPVVRRIVASGRTPLVRAHLLWSDQHNFGEWDIPVIKREAKRWNELALAFPGVKIEVSPVCEHNLVRPERFLAIVEQAAPACHPVNTPFRGKLSKLYKNEVHGEHPRPKGPGSQTYNFSFDGTHALEVNVAEFKVRHASAEVFFLWHPLFNLKTSVTDKTPRDKRKVKPSGMLFEDLIGAYSSNP